MYSIYDVPPRACKGNALHPSLGVSCSPSGCAVSQPRVAQSRPKTWPHRPSSDVIQTVTGAHKQLIKISWRHRQAQPRWPRSRSPRVRRGLEGVEGGGAGWRSGSAAAVHRAGTTVCGPPTALCPPPGPRPCPRPCPPPAPPLLPPSATSPLPPRLPSLLRGPHPPIPVGAPLVASTCPSVPAADIDASVVFPVTLSVVPRHARHGRWRCRWAARLRALPPPPPSPPPPLPVVTGGQGWPSPPLPLRG